MKKHYTEAELERVTFADLENSTPHRLKNTADTKKLNAGIAIAFLQYVDVRGGLTEDEFLDVKDLCKRLINTPLYKNDGIAQDEAGIQHAIKLIEEYLEEEGV